MRRLLVSIIFCIVNFSVNAAINTSEIKYKVGGKDFTGYLAYDDSIKGKRPGILVAHEWWGHDEYARKRARMFAELGYTAFALDMYGTGKHADHPKDAKAFMQAVFSDMDDAKKRFNAAHKILMEHKTVESSKTASIGYCMGGGLSLGMARAGIDLDGVIVVHGSLGTKTPARKGQIKAKVLVLTGEADPFVPTEQVEAFKKEMADADVYYELKVYPGAKHSFSVKGSEVIGEKFEMPLAYNKAADEDSWQRIQEFLKEVFK